MKNELKIVNRNKDKLNNKHYKNSTNNTTKIVIFINKHQLLLQLW